MGLFDGILNQPKSASDQTKEDKDIVSDILKKLDDSRNSSTRITSEGVWLTNCAYLMGFDGVYFDTQLRQFKSTKGQSKLARTRLYINKILPTVNNRLSRLCKNPPKWEVAPNSADNEDKEAARLAFHVIEDIYQKQNVEQKRIPLTMWMQQAGHAYMKVCYDDQLGKPMVDPETNELMYEGDIRVDAVSAFEVFPDPMATTLEECRYVIHAKVRPLEYFRSHYAERGDLVKPEGVWLLSLQNEERVNSINSFGRGETQSQQTPNNSAIEITYYEKRSQAYPMGRMVTIANGVKLQDKSLPVGEIPFAKFDDIVVGGKYYSESVITHMRPIQDQFTRLMSQRAMWTNRLLAGKYIAAKGHGLIQEALNDQSGEVLEYDNVPGAPPPSAVQVPNIPQYAYAEEESLEKHLYDIPGINEISRSQLPSAGIPAKGMEFLQEQDETRIGIVTTYNEYSWARTFMLALMYAQEYYKTERLLKICGKNMQYTFKNFVGADLRNNHDVRVVKGSTIPGSRFLKRTETLNLFREGLLGDPADPKVREKVFNNLEFGFSDQLWEDYGIDMAQIQRSIEELKQGIPSPISELDNNALHVQEKNKIRKSEEFDAYPDEVKALWMQDINERLNVLVNAVNPDLQAQAKMEDAKYNLAQDELEEMTDYPVEGKSTIEQEQMARAPVPQGEV